MLEKEIKILDIDKDEVIKTLEKIGAEKSFEGVIHDVYYDFPEDNEDKAHKMEANKRLFRVRQKGEIHMYTIKRKRNKKVDGGEKGVKIADEHETLITDVDSFAKVLEKYGLKKIREKKKHRISYAMEGYEFDIDDYEGIPTLLEIEAHSAENLKSMTKKLGLENYQIETFGSRGLFEHYKKDYSYL